VSVCCWTRNPVCPSEGREFWTQFWSAVPIRLSHSHLTVFPRFTLLFPSRRVAMFFSSGSPGTGEGGDWWSWPMGVKAEGTPRVCHREWKNTPASLGYPPSVFNKNSTLECQFWSPPSIWPFWVFHKTRYNPCQSFLSRFTKLDVIETWGAGVETQETKIRGKFATVSRHPLRFCKTRFLKPVAPICANLYDRVCSAEVVREHPLNFHWRTRWIFKFIWEAAEKW